MTQPRAALAMKSSHFLFPAWRLLALAALAWSVQVAPASAQLLLSNGNPASGPRFFLKSDTVPNPQWGADSFSLGQGATATGVTFWGSWNFYHEPVPNIQVSFLADNGSGLPGAVVATRHLDNYSAVSTGEYLGWYVYRFAGTFADVALDANQTYWMSIYDDTPTNSSQYLLLLLSDYYAPGARSNDLGQTWYPAGGDLTFELHGDWVEIPEPTALPALALAGLTASVLFSRRRLRRKGSNQ